MCAERLVKTMKKIFLMLLLIFCVISCELKKAQEAYDRKEYLESMKIVLKYFEKNPHKLQKIKPDIKNDLIAKFSNIVSIYERKAYNGTPDEKIEGYSSLGQIYMLVDKYSASHEFTNFTREHNLNSIYDNYESLISQKIQDNMSWENYENIYQTVKKYYNEHIEFMEELMNSGKMTFYREVHEKMSRSKADKLIDIAQRFENSGNYRNAEKLYLDASKTYSRYDENYRQAKTRYYETKQRADLIDAEKSYNLGLAEVRKNTKSSYRKAANYFEEAAKFVPNYRDSKELARKYESMGEIHYYFSECPTTVENYISSGLARVGSKKMSIGHADVVISCDMDTRYRVYEGLPKRVGRTEVGQVRDKNGMFVTKQYMFQEIEKISTETMDMKYTIKLSGLSRKSVNGSFSVENKYKELVYSGDVPEKYRSVKESPLGKDEMKKKAYKTMLDKAHTDLEEIIKVIKNL